MHPTFFYLYVLGTNCFRIKDVKHFRYPILINKPKGTLELSLTMALAQLVRFSIDIHIFSFHMLKWSLKYRESQISSMDSLNSKSTIETSNINTNSRWKKINNTIRFINASKARIKRNNTRNYLINTKRKNPSKWTLIKNTFSIINFLSRLQKEKFKTSQKVSPFYNYQLLIQNKYL